jgi:small subunit ribosomal protein S16
MLTIRMRRMGSKKKPFFRVVVIDSRAPRDGRSVEVLGYYNPRSQPEVMNVDRERLAHWLNRGARPSDTLRTLLTRRRVPADTGPVAAEGPATS